jgi:hypothetical protein
MSGINVRVYKPKRADSTNKPQPFMIYYHGGYDDETFLKFFIVVQKLKSF